MKILSLQGFRAIAIFMFFLMHSQTFLLEDPGELKHFFMFSGRSGTWIFFMLSGYLFAIKNEKIEQIGLVASINKSWRKFKKLRFIYIITAVFSILAYLPIDLKHAIMYLCILPLNLLYIHDIIPYASICGSFNGPAWFISALFIIYCLIYTFPKFTNIFLEDRPKRMLLFILLIFGGQFLYQIFFENYNGDLLPYERKHYITWMTYFNPIFNYSIFILGMCMQKIPTLLKKVLNNGFVILLCITLAFLLIFYSLLDDILNMIVLEGLFGIIITSIANYKTWISSVLSNKVLVYCGNISGFFFLIHGSLALNMKYLTFIEPPISFIILLSVSFVLSVTCDVLIQNNKKIFNYD